MTRFLLPLLVLLLLFLARLRAGTVVAALECGETSSAVEVVDGDRLLLENGREVSLVGIQASKLPLGRAGFKAWSLADEAKQALEGLAFGKTLTLYYGTSRRIAMFAHSRICCATMVSGRKTNCWRREWRGFTAFATTAV